ncbi:hypothetical protein LTR84_013090 [Exophiala bonariae]|uniref:Receptor L-domain domain-containing protein n=1 Tax=Exophiala bonariae TaxID=1690606 RepID=A0AAV9NDZ0_9EURO|nr:hypothetical protein LTR84_013090 [Exophiala bonariae]
MIYYICLLLAATVVQVVFAQCDGPSVTISTADDATGISNCGTFNGDIIIADSISGPLALTGISHLKGDLTCNNATKLTEISFHQLVTISGSFTLTGLTTLSNLKFDSLMEVGDIIWNDLPALQTMDFTTGIVTADRVSISNTKLRSLSDLKFTSCNAIEIFNNPELATVSFNDLTNTTDTISISDNSPSLEVEFQKLASSRGLTLQNANALNVPLLDTLVGNLNLSYNSFRSFSAPSLTLVVDVFITSNPLLSSLSFPLLPEINGNLLITNNSRLGAISFPKLQTVSGSLNLTGEFSRADFPVITNIQGDTIIETTINNSTICGQFNSTGTVTCNFGTEPPQDVTIDTSTNSTSTNSGGGNTNDTSSNDSGGNSSTSSGGISGAAIGGIVAGVIVLVLAAGGFWWWRRRKNQNSGRPEKLEDSTPELPMGGHHEKPELQGSERFRHQDPSMYELKDNPMRKGPTYGRAELGWDNQIAEMEGSSVPEMSSDGRR